MNPYMVRAAWLTIIGCCLWTIYLALLPILIVSAVLGVWFMCDEIALTRHRREQERPRLRVVR